MAKRFNLKTTASILKKSQVVTIKIAEKVGLMKNGGRWEFTEEEIFLMRYESSRKKDKIQNIIDATGVGRGMVRSIMNRFKLSAEADYNRLLAVCSLWKSWEDRSLTIIKDI